MSWWYVWFVLRWTEWIWLASKWESNGGIVCVPRVRLLGLLLPAAVQFMAIIIPIKIPIACAVIAADHLAAELCVENCAESARARFHIIKNPEEEL